MISSLPGEVASLEAKKKELYGTLIMLKTEQKDFAITKKNIDLIFNKNKHPLDLSISKIQTNERK